ncbi:MAG TPA: hypothetical protein VK524_27380, partial [Polyangiaceae bacterium]|nr:hypothetical protein [Polyangiaceae bacterium]
TMGLYELVQCEAASHETPDEPLTLPAHTIEARLQHAAQLLLHHGSRVLSGDFSVRPALLSFRAEEWLQQQYRAVMQAKRYPSLDGTFAQIKWEYARFQPDHKQAIWRALEHWLKSGDDEKRDFATRVAEYL